MSLLPPYAGSGFGKAHKENMQVLKTYRTMHWLYLIQVWHLLATQSLNVRSL